MNPGALEGWPKPGIIAVPNCTTITAMMAVGPLHRAAGLRSLILSSYQSVSGAGHKGVAELAEQVQKLHGMEDDLGHPDMDAMPVGDVMGKTIAYNVVPKIAAFEENGFTGEESKMMAEPGQILGLPDLEVSEVFKPKPRAKGAESGGLTCASCHLTPDGKIRGPYNLRAPHDMYPTVTMRDPAGEGRGRRGIERGGRDRSLRQRRQRGACHRKGRSRRQRRRNIVDCRK